MEFLYIFVLFCIQGRLNYIKSLMLRYLHCQVATLTTTEVNCWFNEITTVHHVKQEEQLQRILRPFRIFDKDYIQ